MAVIQIIRKLAAQKLKLEKELLGLEGTLLADDPSVTKKYGVAIRRIERKIKKTSLGPQIEGFKSREASTKAYRKYQDAYAEQLKIVDSEVKNNDNKGLSIKFYLNW